MPDLAPTAAASETFYRDLLRLASVRPAERFFAQLHDLLRIHMEARTLIATRPDVSGAATAGMLYARDADRPSASPTLDPASYEVRPIPGDGGRIVRFAVSLPRSGRFDARERAMIDASADLAALVMRAIASADDARVSDTALHLLLSTSRALASERDPNALFARLHELVAGIMDVDVFWVALRSADETKMDVAYDSPEGLVDTTPKSLPIDASIAGHVFRGSEPLLLRNEADWAAYPHVRSDDDQVKSAIVVPLRIESRTIGVMSVQSFRTDAYDLRERDLMVAIAEQAAIAVENASHWAAAKHKNRELNLLSEVARALSSELSLGALCRTVYEEVSRVMDASVFYVGLREADEAEFRIEYFVENGVTAQVGGQTLEGSMAGRVVRSNRPLVLTSSSEIAQQQHRHLAPGQVPSVPGSSAPGPSVRSVLMAPLRLGERCIGLISAQSYDENAYGESSVRLLTAIAEQMAVAVQNAQLFGDAKNRAERDPLTEVFHHRSLQTRLEDGLERARKADRPLAVLMLDLDNFKLVNDTYGHLVGDEALVAMTSVLVSTCRTSDVIGRYGGDEFMVILPDASEQEALAVAERIEACLSEKELAIADGTIPLRCSIGVAMFPRDGQNAKELVGKADAALYQSKRLGRPEPKSQRIGGTRLRLMGDFAPVSELLAALLARDPSTRDHLEHVNRVAFAFGARLNLARDDAESLLLASVLHDLGKIAVPDYILRKPGPLDDAQMDIIRQHPRIGATLIEHIPGFNGAALAVLHHHERFEGGGYPDGISGKNIPLVARIVSLVDAYSAMIMDRPYHKGLLSSEAVAELRRCAGSQFDPELVEEFAEMVESGGGS